MSRAHEPWAWVAVTASTAVSIALFVGYPFQPMQDLGHHMAIAAIVADYTHIDSLYPAIYEAMNPLQANSLLYSVASGFARFMTVTHAVLLSLALSFAALSLTTAFALRQSRLSIWGAVLTPALVHSLIFVAGFANLLFALPLMVLALPLHDALLRRPTLGRGAALSLTLVLLFLAHAHAFLWVGAVLAVLSLGAFTRAAWRFLRATQIPTTPGIFLQGSAALGAALPSLFLFASWYHRTFGAGRTEGGVLASTAGWSSGFGASFRTLSESVRDLPAFVFNTTQDDSDLNFVVAAAVVAGVSVVACPGRKRAPRFMQVAFALTFASYFFLPEGLQGHDIVASRQPALALLFLPALLSPPAFTRAPRRHICVVAMLLAAGVYHFATWQKLLHAFDLKEIAGLPEVLAAAPPRKRLHHVKLDPGSAFFGWRPMWHVEKFYMSSKLGQTADTPAVLSTGALRVRTGVDVHRLTSHSAYWPQDREVWEYFDLVLVRRWAPPPGMLEVAEKHAHLLSKHGDWELWERNPGAHGK